MSTTLYRIYAEDALLYIGVSSSAVNRFVQHTQGLGWCDKRSVTSMTMEHFDSREQALHAEEEAIGSESPIFNKTYNLKNQCLKPQPMKNKPTYTKAQARELLGAKNNSDLARKLGVIRQTVSAWGGDDDPIPEGRYWQVRALLAERGQTAA